MPRADLGKVCKVRTVQLGKAAQECGYRLFSGVRLLSVYQHTEERLGEHELPLPSFEDWKMLDPQPLYELLDPFVVSRLRVLPRIRLPTRTVAGLLLENCDLEVVLLCQ